MSVDYRLLGRFEASQRRHQAARRIIPERWRDDPRPVAQIISDQLAGVIVATARHRDGGARSAQLPAFPADDR
jgi:hypothetical protein